MALLEFKNVSYVYDDKSILKNVSFGINTGDFISVVGQSGSGKSTLLRLCSDLISPTEGEIIFNGKTYSQYPPTDLRKSIAYCFQSPYLFGSSVLDNVKFPYIIRNMKPDIEKIETWFAMFNMTGDYLQMDVKNLSGGEKQRIALIRSILFMPEILLLDEITSLVLVTLIFSYWQKLNLGKDVVIGVMRAAVQLVIVGYILEFVFGYNNHIFTTTLLAFMIFNAAYNAAKRGKSIKNGLAISFLAISLGTIVTLMILVLSKTIQYAPNQIIPVSGMLVGNSMVALGLCYKQIEADFKNKRDEVETKLSLGADILPSSIEIIRDAMKTGMLPTIDSAKTLGIVALPGMMTGLILAGISPIDAIKYQIMVTFMLLSTTAISSLVACYLSYRSFFNKRKQLTI